MSPWVSCGLLDVAAGSRSEASFHSKLLGEPSLVKTLTKESQSHQYERGVTQIMICKFLPKMRFDGHGSRSGFGNPEPLPQWFGETDPVSTTGLWKTQWKGSFFESYLFYFIYFFIFREREIEHA